MTSPTRESRSDDISSRGTELPRATARWSPAFDCRVTCRFGATVVKGRVVDWSEAGARVVSDSDQALPSDRAASGDATFEFGGRCVVRTVRLRWVRPGTTAEFGLEFTTRGERLVLDLDAVDVDPREALRIPTALAVRRRVLPLCERDGVVVTACVDVGDRASLDLVARAVGRPVVAQAVDATVLARTIQRVHGDPRLAAVTAGGDQVATFEHVMYAAWLRRASDVHVRPERDGVHVFLRVDGRLEPFRVLPTESHSELLTRIKVLAGMDIAERRAPQDGRFTLELQGGVRVDIRVATLPTNHGERATLRLLAIGQESLTLENLGMVPHDLERCRRNLARPHGMILATGPTGCGKTTTLFAALREITAARRVNAIAIQEPVEYDIPGISQVEIDGGGKVTFPSALRSIMRHDPDVILVGEVRDAETASIAIKAALTGHLVLATLHTNSAASAVTRLADMGVERYLIAATLRLVVAQRLARRLCAHCRRPLAVPPAVAGWLGVAEIRGYRGAGCVYCAGRGEHGRIGLFEAIEFDRDLADAVRSAAPESRVEDLARERGMVSLRDDALGKLRSGAASAESILEVIEPGESRGEVIGG